MQTIVSFPLKPNPASAGMQALRKVHVFSHASDDDLARMESLSTIACYKRAQYIVLDHTLATRLFFVSEGRARLTAATASGKTVALADCAAGDAIGLSNAVSDRPCLYAQRLQVDANTILCSMTYSDFRALLASNAELRAAALQYVCDAHQNLHERYIERMTLDVGSRVIHELRRLTASSSETTLTHAEFADRVGASREAVTRQLSALQRDGVIQVRRRRIMIEDPSKLRGLVERKLHFRI
jgi:CRP-like cAMP-binding protein